MKNKLYHAAAFNLYLLPCSLRLFLWPHYLRKTTKPEGYFRTIHVLEKCIGKIWMPGTSSEHKNQCSGVSTQLFRKLASHTLATQLATTSNESMVARPLLRLRAPQLLRNGRMVLPSRPPPQVCRANPPRGGGGLPGETPKRRSSC